MNDLEKRLNKLMGRALSLAKQEAPSIRRKIDAGGHPPLRYTIVYILSEMEKGHYNDAASIPFYPVMYRMGLIQKDLSLTDAGKSYLPPAPQSLSL